MSGRLSNFPSIDRKSCDSPRRNTASPERDSPIRSEKAIPSPEAIFHSTPIVGLVLRVSICDSAARLTPVSCAS